METNLNLSILAVVILLAAGTEVPPSEENRTEMTISLDEVQGSRAITVTVTILDSENKSFFLRKEGTGVEGIGDGPIDVRADQEEKYTFVLKVIEPEFQLTLSLERDGETLIRRNVVGNHDIMVEEELLGNLAVPQETGIQQFSVGFTVFNTSRETMTYRVTAFGDKFQMTEHDPILLNPGDKDLISLSISPMTEGNGNLFVNFQAGGEITLSKYYAVRIIAPDDSECQDSESSGPVPRSFRLAHVLILLVFLLVSAILILFHGKMSGGGLKW